MGGRSGAVVGAGLGGAAGAGVGRSITQHQPQAHAYSPGGHYERASYRRDDYRHDYGHHYHRGWDKHHRHHGRYDD
jgi:hypothetical protein